jgi:hypothetical protein
LRLAREKGTPLPLTGAHLVGAKRLGMSCETIHKLRIQNRRKFFRQFVCRLSDPANS